MVYCRRTRDESNPSAASTQQRWKVLIWPPTRDHEQSGRSPFVYHVGQIGALASEAGQEYGVLLPVFNSNEGKEQSVCWRRPAHGSNRKHTTATGISIASKAGPRTAEFPKLPVISGRRRPGVSHKRIWALLSRQQATKSRSL